MWICYLIACLPLIAGAFLWRKYEQVTIWEWAVAFGAGLGTALLFQYLAVASMTSDYETWSGKVVLATHHPWWKAEWTETESYTDSDGNTKTRTVHKSEDHPEHWSYDVEFGQGPENFEISEHTFGVILWHFGNLIRKTQPYKSNFSRGDPNEYVVDNRTGYIQPAWKSCRFENRIKAAPSVFSYAKVPGGAGVYPYPVCEAGREPPSGRLIGTATSIGWLDWDLLNTELGPRKQVNLIAIGFGSKDSSIAQLQEAAWIGGKKNDLVICYGGDDPLKPTWAYCFGWTEHPLVKRNLESLFLAHVVDPSILSDVRDEVATNYHRKDWHSFDYITVEPPGWCYLVQLLVVIVVQVLIWMWAFRNEYGKGGKIWKWRRYGY